MSSIGYGPIKLVYTEAASPEDLASGVSPAGFGPAGEVQKLTTRTLTLNSTSFYWASEEGPLMLRGFDEDRMTTVDLVASNVRFL